MDTWILLVAVTSVGSIISLIGGLYLVYGKVGVRSLRRAAVPFAAGALLAASFLDLLPEAFHQSDDAEAIFLASLIGLVGFFVLERGLSWFHHHHEHVDDSGVERRNASLIIIGDTLHNFIDGIAIGAAFLVNPVAGIVAAVAVAAHEIPQEVGDFALLLSKGMSKSKVVLVNIASAVATLIGAVLAYGLGGNIGIDESVLLAFIAGCFIYIAASDIIPSIHAEPKRKTANLQTIILLLGIFVMAVVADIAHGYVEADAINHGSSDSHSHDSHSTHE
jgi:zinc and cadmium transporter